MTLLTLRQGRRLGDRLMPAQVVRGTASSHVREWVGRGRLYRSRQPSRARRAPPAAERPWRKTAFRRRRQRRLSGGPSRLIRRHRPHRPHRQQPPHWLLLRESPPPGVETMMLRPRHRWRGPRWRRAVENWERDRRRPLPRSRTSSAFSSAMAPLRARTRASWSVTATAGLRKPVTRVSPATAVEPDC